MIPCTLVIQLFSLNVVKKVLSDKCKELRERDRTIAGLEAQVFYLKKG